MKYFVGEPKLDNKWPLFDFEEDDIVIKLKHGLYIYKFPLHVSNSLDFADFNVYDYQLAQNFPLVSKRFTRLIDEFDILKPQLIPVIIKDRIDFSECFVLNLPFMIRCLDMQQSEVEIDSDGYIRDISKIVLDHKSISNYPKELTGIIRLREMSTIYIYREDIVSAATDKLTGIRFIDTDIWNPDMILE